MPRYDKSIGEIKASAEFIKFEQNKVLFNDKTSEDFKKQKSQIHQLNKELLYLKAYSRRENLIITGIPEAQDATEDTLKVLQNFMAHKLNVSDEANIDFQRVLRLGKPKHKGPRAMIARFLKYPDKERILSLGRICATKISSCFLITPKKFNGHGNDNLRNSRTPNQLAKRLPLAKAGRIC